MWSLPLKSGFLGQMKNLRSIRDSKLPPGVYGLWWWIPAIEIDPHETSVYRADKIMDRWTQYFCCFLRLSREEAPSEIIQSRNAWSSGCRYIPKMSRNVSWLISPAAPLSHNHSKRQHSHGLQFTQRKGASAHHIFQLPLMFGHSMTQQTACVIKFVWDLPLTGICSRNF